MTQPGIEPLFPRSLANTLPTRPVDPVQSGALGYLTRMEDVRQPKLLFYRELHHGSSLRLKLEKHFKDVVKNIFRVQSRNIGDRPKKLTVNLSAWKKVIYESCKESEARTTEYSRNETSTWWDWLDLTSTVAKFATTAFSHPVNNLKFIALCMYLHTHIH